MTARLRKEQHSCEIFRRLLVLLLHVCGSATHLLQLHSQLLPLALRLTGDQLLLLLAPPLQCLHPASFLLQTLSLLQLQSTVINFEKQNKSCPKEREKTTQYQPCLLLLFFKNEPQASKFKPALLQQSLHGNWLFTDLVFMEHYWVHTFLHEKSLEPTFSVVIVILMLSLLSVTSTSNKDDIQLITNQAWNITNATCSSVTTKNKS